MKDIVVIGGGYPDLFDLIEDINLNKKKINILAIVDKKRKKRKNLYGYSVVKSIKEIISKKKPYIVNGVASSIEARISVYNELKKNFTFLNLIHPSIKDKNFSIGSGNIICSQVFIGKNCTIGNNNLISPQVFIGHDSSISDNCIFGPAAKIMGSVKIQNDVVVGASSSILQNLLIKKKSIISIGSVIFNDLGESSVAIGNPARCIKKN
jgi:sugar O-acyltransferase (sialic acid O-acetyltransferase NeuD family)